MNKTAVKHHFTFNDKDMTFPRLHSCSYCGFLTTTPQNNRDDVCHYVDENGKPVSEEDEE